MGEHIEGKLIRIFIGEGDRHQRKPLYVAIVHLAREMGLGGATVLRGIEGFGADSVVHTTRLLRLSEDLPIIIEIVGTEQKLAPFLERVEALLDEVNCGGLMTMERVEVIRYGPQKR